MHLDLRSHDVTGGLGFAPALIAAIPAVIGAGTAAAGVAMKHRDAKKEKRRERRERREEAAEQAAAQAAAATLARRQAPGSGAPAGAPSWWTPGRVVLVGVGGLGLVGALVYALRARRGARRRR